VGLESGNPLREQSEKKEGVLAARRRSLSDLSLASAPTATSTTTLFPHFNLQLQV
jgi:hypothetical protein